MPALDPGPVRPLAFPPASARRVVEATLAALLVALLSSPAAWACPACREAARARALDSGPVGTAALLLLPLLVVAGAAVLLYRSDCRSRDADPSTDR